LKSIKVQLLIIVVGLAATWTAFIFLGHLYNIEKHPYISLLIGNLIFFGVIFGIAKIWIKLFDND